MDRRAQAGVLLAVAAVALRLGLTDAALAYVKSGLRPLLTLAGIALGVIGASTLLPQLRDEGRATRADPRTSDGTMPHPGAGGDGAHEPAIGWMLVLPLLALLLIAPPPLGAFAAARQSSRLAQPSQLSYPPLPPAEDGTVRLTLAEYRLRALYDDSESLSGARIRLTGFVTPSEDGEGYLLTRFVLSCCAADGIAVQVRIQGDSVARPADAWLEVEGRWMPTPVTAERARGVPVLSAQQVVVIPAPAQPYEY
ncbi:MAG TPA: TIGR03943 family protein [Egibacteraceae bacterium]|nr:TIGR03943 family protein [Egibacteraceae bacterium]